MNSLQENGLKIYKPQDIMAPVIWYDAELAELPGFSNYKDHADFPVLPLKFS